MLIIKLHLMMKKCSYKNYQLKKSKFNIVNERQNLC